MHAGAPAYAVKVDSRFPSLARRNSTATGINGNNTKPNTREQVDFGESPGPHHMFFSVRKFVLKERKPRKHTLEISVPKPSCAFARKRQSSLSVSLVEKETLSLKPFELGASTRPSPDARSAVMRRAGSIR